MKVTDLAANHVGATIRIETKVKSRPISGLIEAVEGVGPVRRVRVQGAYGSKWHTLTEHNEVSLTD